MDTVICKEVIITTLKRRGEGTKASPIRTVTEVYEKDGTLIAEKDSFETFVEMDLIHFARWVKRMDYDPDKMDKHMVDKWRNDIEKHVK